MIEISSEEVSCLQLHNSITFSSNSNITWRLEISAIIVMEMTLFYYEDHISHRKLRSPRGYWEWCWQTVDQMCVHEMICTMTATKTIKPNNANIISGELLTTLQKKFFNQPSCPRWLLMLFLLPQPLRNDYLQNGGSRWSLFNWSKSLIAT